MLRSIESLKGCMINATDGEIGRVEKVIFDDTAWQMRFFIVATGRWMERRHALISTDLVRGIDAITLSICVDLTCQQVKETPDVDAGKQVSRKDEAEYLHYFGYPRSRSARRATGMKQTPEFSRPSMSAVSSHVRAQLARYGANLHEKGRLHAASAVIGYDFEAIDGAIGHVSGFIFDDESWTVRYLSIRTRSWWSSGREVLVPTSMVRLIDWYESTVTTELTFEAIEKVPSFHREIILGREVEAAVYAAYGSEGYWLGARVHSAGDQVRDAAILAR